MPQTTVSNPTIGYAGMRTKREHSDKTESYLNNLSTAIKLGYGVCIDVASGNDCVRVPAASTDLPAGLVWDDQSLEAENVATGYAQNKPVPVLQRGTGMAIIEEDVSVNDPVYLRYTDDGAKKKGMFGKTSDGGKNYQITGARWKADGAVADGYAELEISLP